MAKRTKTSKRQRALIRNLHLKVEALTTSLRLSREICETTQGLLDSHAMDEGPNPQQA